MTDRLSYILTNYRKVSALLALVLLILMLAFSKPPVIDSRLSGYNIDHNPYDSIGQRMASLFGSKNIIQVLVRPEPGSARNLFTGLDEAEKAIEEAFPGTRVESLTSARRLLAGGADVDRPVREMLTEALRIPVAGNLVSRDTNSLLLVAFTGQSEDPDLGRFDSITGLQFTGIESMHPISQYHIQEEIEKAIIRDYLIILPLILLFIIVFLFLSYRSPSAVLFCMINLGLSVVPVIFFLTLFGVSINQVTSSAIPIVFILSLSSSVHLVTGFIHRAHEGDLNSRVFSTLRYYIAPTFLSSLTTAIAFGSFFLSDSNYIRQFGRVTACSVLVVFILTYLVAPLTLRLIDVRRAPLLRFRFTDAIREKLFSGRKEIALTLLLIAGVSIFLIPGIKFRTNLETYIPRHTAAYDNTLLMQEAFHSLAEIDILVEPGRDAVADSSENLSGLLIPAVAGFSESISLYPGVASVQSVSDQMEFEQSRTLFGIPAVRFPRHGNPYVSEDREKYRINVKLKGQEDIGAVTERMAQDFRKYEPSLTYGIYSEFLMFDYISTSVTRSLLRSLLFSAILIFLTFFTITTNIRAVLASILANLVPLGFLILIFVVFKVDMNITTSITLVICLGLIVDDTIQILYRRVRLDEPMEELGFGVLTTTLIMAGGFLSFLLSQSRPIQIFGLLCAIVFLVAAVSDMTIISWLVEKRKNGISGKTSAEALKGPA